MRMLKHGGGIVGKLVAQRAHQGTGVHGGLQAFSADVPADDDEQGLVLERKHLEEVSAYSVDGQVGALQHEVAGEGSCVGISSACTLRAAGDFCVGTLFVLADADESIENDRYKTGEKDGVGYGACAEGDGAEVEVLRLELLGKPMPASSKIKGLYRWSRPYRRG